MIEIVSICLPVLVLSAWLTKRLLDPNSRYYHLDHPNDRSLHQAPTPRSGGLAIISSAIIGFFCIALLVSVHSSALWILSGLLLVSGVSYFDDRNHIPAGYRLAVHLIAASLLMAGGLEPTQNIVPGNGIPLSETTAWVFGILLCAWMINLYNFMDGMDGFAGGMSVAGFTALGIIGIQSGHPEFAAFNFVAASAACGFLLFNFPPARIFMGDVGSSSLGFLAVASSLWGAKTGVFSLWIPILVFSPFIVDASITLARRIFRREKIWQAHKSHYYQRLVLSGWGHRKTVVAEYGLMTACAVSAIFAIKITPEQQLMMIAAWTFVYIVIILLINRLSKGRLESELDSSA